jgi:hypothetical protein
MRELFFLETSIQAEVFYLLIATLSEKTLEYKASD